MRSLYLGRGPLGRMLKAPFMLLPARARRRGLGVVQRRVRVRQPPGLDKALERELRERFGGEVAALSDYLGRDLVTLWGYDCLER